MKKTKILIAEDDRISFEYLKEILKGRDIEIFLAKNGNEAVEICTKEPDIDLVFMDIKMPQRDGREATRDIKALRPELPIIAQTAYALDDERETILQEGFDAYLAKPIQRSEVLSVLDKFLN
ncbi:MAG: response regulator [Candidatus Marinimicrobia bacterium]|nr:response regulator [Candidatus Neomarinimicrobiota bacterium]